MSRSVDTYVRLPVTGNSYEVESLSDSTYIKRKREMRQKNINIHIIMNYTYLRILKSHNI